MNRDNYVLRLAMYHPRFGDDLGLFADNDPAIIFPQEATEEDAKLIGDFLKESVKPFEQEENKLHGPLILNACASACVSLPRHLYFWRIFS